MQGGWANSCQLGDAKVVAPLEAAWESIRSGLRRDLGARTFDGWLKPAELGGFDPDSGTLDIVMPSQFMADWVRSHFGERLALAWKTTLPIVRDIRIIAAADAPRPAPLLVLDEMPPPGRARSRRAQFRPALPVRKLRRRQGQRSRGDSRADARDAERSASTRSSSMAAPGAARPICCTPSATRSASAIRGAPDRFDVGREVHGRVHPRAEGKRHDRLQERLRCADLLLIDDVQFIAGKDSTQEEFFHTMNEIIGAGRRLVITSDRAPQDLDGIAPRILSRLSWGLVADINSADFELRFNIIVAKLGASRRRNAARRSSTSSPGG